MAFTPQTYRSYFVIHLPRDFEGNNQLPQSFSTDPVREENKAYNVSRKNSKTQSGFHDCFIPF